jgi:hypothetical protein
MKEGELIINEWFPTVIGFAVCPFYKDIKTDVVKYIKSFKKEHVYKEHYNEKKIKKLNDWIKEKVNEYTKLHNFQPVEPFEGWFAINQVNTHQPYHTHYGATISSNFFVDSNFEDVPTVFKHPNNYIANGWKMSPEQSEDNNLYNHYTFLTCSYRPVEGGVVIFRSHIEHGTPMKKLKSPRITLTYNYK